MKKKICRIEVALTVIFSIICIGYIQYSSSKNLISANSKQIITLDSDTPYKYELPTPSRVLNEIELQKNPDLEGYVQSSKLTTVVNLDASNEKGEYIAGRQFYGNSNALILKGNTPGFIIGDNSFGAPNPDSLPARTSSMFIIPDSNGSYSEIYSLLSDTVYNVDGNFNNTPNDDTFSPFVFEGGDNENIVLFSTGNGNYMKKINTDTYPSKPTNAIKTDFGSYTSQTIYRRSLDFRTKEIFLYGRAGYSNTKLKAFKLDIDSNKVIQELNLERPNLTYAYNQMIGYNLKPENFFSEIGKMISFKDGSYLGQIFIGDSGGKALFEYLVHWDSSGNIIEMTDPNNSGIVSTSFIDYNLESDTLNFSYSENGGSYTHYSSITGGNFSTIKNLIDYSKSNTFSVKTANINSEIKYSFSGNINLRSDPNVAGYSSGFVFGFMDSNFKIVSASTISKDLTYFNGDTYTVDSNVYIAGSFQGDKNFLTIPPIGGWKNGIGIRSFFGKLGLYTDYSPAINAGKYSIVNKDDLTEKNTDELLINGLDNKYPVGVYDTVDGYDDNSIENLKKRINRNPKNIELPIDWSVLGVNTDKVGPNKGTYFVSDTQLLTTTTTRTVNIIDSHTKYDETVAKSALHAQNFAIKLDDLKGMQESGGLTVAALTEAATTDSYGHVLAWNLNTGDINAQVQVDAKELANINGAKGFGQYPLTYTLKDEQGNLLLTKDGTPLKRETFVYVLDKNSQVVGEKGTTIFNSDAIKLPWDITSTMTEGALGTKVMTDGNVVAYDFETGEDITSKIVTPVTADLTDLIKATEPTDKKNPPTTDNPTQVIHYLIKRDTEEESATTTVGTTVTVYYRFESLIVSFVDVAFGQLYDVEKNELAPTSVTIADQIVGKPSVAITTNTDVAEKITAIKAKGYEQEKVFKADKKTEITTATTPITYNNGDGNQVYIRFNGLLTLVSVPETIDFNLQAVNPKKTVRVDNPSVTGDLVVSDTRAGTDNKWALKVKLSEPIQSTNKTGSKVTLPNALRYKSSGKDEFTVTSEAQEITRENSGFGTYDVSSGWGSTKEATGFKFETPPVYVARLGEYEGEITYIISDTYEP